MKFIPSTQSELKSLNIQNDELYQIEYLNKDYFNGDESIEKTQAKAIISNDVVSFIISDDYGMDKFVSNFRVIRS
ncbi:MAG: hypothetical protein HOF69_05775 [Campylobacteraceae bacterium]|jgi:hypothetical protein|nr:hypothetical protein [Campylobacteraceae bacterium]MBT3882749.1 hypothetical protein [Campylobacteraceae bacterium]MBT4571799.1 hypothetical protein [Campylobacteraceae bacterium]MBT5324137.1 hypothetical protein [Campylobacteraceae bacterium]MBT6108105.1 hypothetical protein [Campylobacteraceae bacterium]